MSIDPNVAIGVGIPGLLGLVWLVRLEGRVNKHEGECAQRQIRLDERHTAITEKLEHIDAKLDRIMEKA